MSVIGVSFNTGILLKGSSISWVIYLMVCLPERGLSRIEGLYSMWALYFFDFSYSFSSLEVNKDEEKENVPATPTSDPAVKTGDAKLSPPKSAPTEVLHQKRKLKPSPFGSKFGRWLSARNFNQAFTPRALYCRSNSDSATLKTKSAQKQDAAEEADKEKNGIDF